MLLKDIVIIYLWLVIFKYFDIIKNFFEIWKKNYCLLLEREFFFLLLEFKIYLISFIF